MFEYYWKSIWAMPDWTCLVLREIRMMQKVAAVAIVLSGLAAGPASAACLYQGGYYPQGTTLCFDGWLQECTVADYWKAIGMCHAPDIKEPFVTYQKPDAQTLMAKILAGGTRVLPQSVPTDD